MKCPQCTFISSNKRDVCPKCGLDLRAHKKALGLPLQTIETGQSEIHSVQHVPTQTPIAKAERSWISSLLTDKATKSTDTSVEQKPSSTQVPLQENHDIQISQTTSFEQPHAEQPPTKEIPQVMEFTDTDENFEQTLDALIGDMTFDLKTTKAKSQISYKQTTFAVEDDLEVLIEFEDEITETQLEPMQDSNEESFEVLDILQGESSEELFTADTILPDRGFGTVNIDEEEDISPLLLDLHDENKSDAPNQKQSSPLSSAHLKQDLSAEDLARIAKELAFEFEFEFEFEETPEPQINATKVEVEIEEIIEEADSHKADNLHSKANVSDKAARLQQILSQLDSSDSLMQELAGLVADAYGLEPDVLKEQEQEQDVELEAVTQHIDLGLEDKANLALEGALDEIEIEIEFDPADEHEAPRPKTPSGWQEQEVLKNIKLAKQAKKIDTSELSGELDLVFQAAHKDVKQEPHEELQFNPKKTVVKEVKHILLPAKLWRRTLARSIDLIMLTLVSAIFCLMFLFTLDDLITSFTFRTTYDWYQIAQAIQITISYNLTWLIFWFIHEFFFTLAGQTFGKKIFKIQVAAADSNDCTSLQAFTRVVTLPLSILSLGLGLLLALSPTRRTLHDRLASTAVFSASSAS